jgi:hypothetical protein
MSRRNKAGNEGKKGRKKKGRKNEVRRAEDRENGRKGGETHIFLVCVDQFDGISRFFALFLVFLIAVVVVVEAVAVGVICNCTEELL